MTRPAYAYLDPGTGSMILQVVLGGIAGAAVMLKLYWGQFKALFNRRHAPDATAENNRDDGAP